MNLKDLVPGITTLDITQHKEALITIQTTTSFNELATQRAVSQLLKAFGVNIQDENFADTPKRVTKLWKEWLKPTQLKLSAFTSDTKGVVILTGHKTISVCPHHLLPFELDVDVAYIPHGYVIGLSKLARVIDLASGAFALQEHIPEFVVKLLSALLVPRGVICRARARHGCMRMRGVKTPGEVTTISLDGVFLTDEKARAEFLGEAWKK